MTLPLGETLPFRPMTDLMQIGDFARLGGVSVKALRHYEDRGLLAPAWVDPSSGYRYYTLDQTDRLARIVTLRLIDFSISEIAKLLDAGCDDSVATALDRRKSALADEQKALTQKRQIADIIQRAGSGAGRRSLKLAPISDALVYSIKTTAPHLGDPVTEIFEVAETEAADRRADAAPFLLFHDPPGAAGPINLEVCIPVADHAQGSEGVRRLKGAPLSCGLVFSGGYHQTETGYRQMTEWIREAGLHHAGPLREIYHRFGADCDDYDIPHRRLAESPAQYLTELRLPIDIDHVTKEND